MKREDGRSRQASYKALQVAKQAEWALRFAIDDMNDEQISLLTLLEVRPEPDATRLAAVWGAAPDQDLVAAEGALEECRGDLRARVAEALTRKKAPTLVFYVLPHVAEEGSS